MCRNFKRAKSYVWNQLQTLETQLKDLLKNLEGMPLERVPELESFIKRLEPEKDVNMECNISPGNMPSRSNVNTGDLVEWLIEKVMDANFPSLMVNDEQSTTVQEITGYPVSSTGICSLSLQFRTHHLPWTASVIAHCTK